MPPDTLKVEDFDFAEQERRLLFYLSGLPRSDGLDSEIRLIKQQYAVIRGIQHKLSKWVGVPEVKQNPWGLSKRQAQVMDALCEYGCHKLAGKALFISSKTVEAHSARIKSKMPHRTLVQRYLAWDRWRREGTDNPRMTV